MRSLPWTAFGLALLLSSTTAHAESWWKLGSTTEYKGLYIDADSVSVDDDGYGSFRGMFVYPSLWSMNDGRQIRYEVFRAEIDCIMGELYETSRAFYGDDRGYITGDDSGDEIVIEAGTAAAWEENFVCSNPSSWSGYGYYPVSDPISDTRGW